VSEGRTLVLLRHGRTAWNHALRVQGQIDVDLDDEGRAQAARVAPVLAALEPALIWCSDLQRTRQTVAPLAAATGLPVTYDRRLREVHLGEREGLTHAEYAVLAPEEFAQFKRGVYDVAPGAETTAQLRERTVAALRDLLAALAPGRTGVAVSHGGAIRVAVGALLGWPDDVFHSLRGLANTGWVVLAEDTLGGRLRLLAYNRTAGDHAP
jgi:glucosyl-3-phosphoglycerate phosphatase